MTTAPFEPSPSDPVAPDNNPAAPPQDPDPAPAPAPEEPQPTES